MGAAIIESGWRQEPQPMRILVFSRRHTSLGWMSSFPHTRGQAVVDGLRRLGHAAEFRPLPVEGQWDAAICSDYEGDQPWLDDLQRRMTGLSATRLFCLADYGTTGSASAVMAEWFARGGGVLCHLRCRPLAAYEHHIGLGVGDDVRFDPARRRDAVFFDVRRSGTLDDAASFAPETLAAVRRALPSHRLLGSGHADSRIRDHFDEWIAYGTPHAEYVAHFAACIAFVPGGHETLGLAVAEAQVAGAAIVSRPRHIHAEMLVPAATVIDDDPVRGILRAATCDSRQIAAEAAERFCARAMAERIVAVIEASLARPPMAG